LRFCGGGTVTLKVDNPVPGTVYQWRKDGQALSTGNTLLAASTGNYDVAATAANGCTALSAALRVDNLSTAPPLIASAGADRLICTGESVQLGGNPTAASGAPWLSNRRVFGMDRRSNSFIKFSPENPLQFDTISKNILPEDALTANAFFTGGDFTPYGYYVIAPQLNDLYAIDTATGQLQQIGKAVPQQGGSWTGLCWDPSTKNLYATAGTGDNSTLYIIDHFTATARVVATMPVGGLLWLVARHNGDMYTLSSDQYVYSVNKQTGAVTRLPQPVGFAAGFEQDAAVDPLTDSIYLTAKIFSSQPAAEWRLLNTNTGATSVLGPLGDGFSQIDATAIAGPAYQYQWRPATGLINATTAVPTARPAVSTTYTVTVTDRCGNTASSQVTVQVNNLQPSVSISAATDSTCNGAPVRLSATKNSAYAYQWYKDAVLLPGAIDSFYLATEAGTYTVSASISGCSSTSAPFYFKSCDIKISSASSIATCSAVFFDSGGRNGAYNNNETTTRTIIAGGEGNQLRVSFTDFSTEAGQDVLSIYDGDNTNAPLLAVLSGNPSMPLTYTSSSGRLTFSFKSNASVTQRGWEAQLSCYTALVYHSKQSGLLTESSTWEVASGNGFIPASQAPQLYDDSIIIEPGHTVTHTGVAKLDQLWVKAGGTLRLIQSGYLDLRNGKGDDLLIDGTLECRDAGSIDGTGNMVLSGQLYNSVALKNINVRLEVKGDQLPQITSSGSFSAVYIRSASMNITVGKDLSIDTLVLDGPGAVVKVNALQRSLVTINKLLRLQQGRVLMGNNSTLNIAKEALVEGGNSNSFIEGPLRRNADGGGVVSLDFPVGKDVYRPIKMGLYLAEGGLSAFEAEVINAAPAPRNLPPGIKDVSTKRYYRINQLTAQPVSSAIVILSYGPEDGVTDAASLRMVKDDGAGNWLNLGGTGNANNSGSIISNGNFSSFGEFALANASGGNNLLPLQWLSVAAIAVNERVRIIWSVSDEVGVKNYSVERSTDGIHFSSIGLQDARLSSSNRQQYEATDRTALNGINYYRVQQIDNDGRYSYSKIVAVTITIKDALVLAPNPATNLVTIRNSQPIQTLQCFNTNGQLMYTARPGTRQHSIQLQGWPEGLYLLKVMSGDKVMTTRFVKTK
ncbi:MAG TPA: T9SS type A sorting domain-containing protein, partial [Chitinophagaceae bacterium]|nr:T9SS type A sorting domain-containing protein [Chitinophagaceae bacterium]